jgi:ribosomal protein S18 acetylase RimI-like enzyme
MMHDRLSADDSPSTIQIRKIGIGDVSQLAALHRRIFPDYFLTHMGQRFLEHFYREFAGQPENYGLVAISDQEPVGAIIGTTNGAAFYSRLYPHSFGVAVLALARGLVTDPYLRHNLAARSAHMRHALGSILHHRREPVQANTPGVPLPRSARLLSIGVDPGHTGQGIASELVDRFCRELVDNGVEQVGLSVRADNQHAIDFYVKTGWQYEGGTDSLMQFCRTMDPQL